MTTTNDLVQQQTAWALAEFAQRKETHFVIAATQGVSREEFEAIWPSLDNMYGVAELCCACSWEKFLVVSGRLILNPN